MAGQDLTRPPAPYRMRTASPLLPWALPCPSLPGTQMALPPVPSHPHSPPRPPLLSLFLPALRVRPATRS